MHAYKYGFRVNGDVGVLVHYNPMPAQTLYHRFGFRLEMFSETEKYYEEAFASLYTQH